jgi:hypothetical protein
MSSSVPRCSIITALGIGALIAGGCSGGGLTTGSLLPGSSSPASQVAAPTAPVATSTDRALQVASTSARAVKCGYYFDAAKLRSSFLASELQTGASPEQIQRTEREYESARAAMITQISKDPDYCNDERTKVIKADLSRHLAGDFAPSKKVQATGGGWFDGLSSTDTRSREVLDPEWIRDPKLTPNRTKRVE